MTERSSFNQERAQAIDDEAIVGCSVIGGFLILEQRGGGLVNAGSVKGLLGLRGDPGEVTEAGLAAAVAAAHAAGAIDGSQLADDAITTQKLSDGALLRVHLALKALGTGKIADDSISTEKIADNSITSAEIEESVITGARIQDDAITDAKLAPPEYGSGNNLHWVKQAGIVHIYTGAGGYDVSAGQVIPAAFRPILYNVGAACGNLNVRTTARYVRLSTAGVFTFTTTPAAGNKVVFSLQFSRLSTP